MSDTLFDSCTPRYSLPLLFVGQSHKEGFVNEIASRIDALLFLAIEGEADFPPTTSTEGESWLVGTAPSGAWVGHARQIASRQGGNWLFTDPAFGIRLFDKSKNQDMYFRREWRLAPNVTAPTGGTTVDNESRLAITGIIEALRVAGVIQNG